PAPRSLRAPNAEFVRKSGFELDPALRRQPGIWAKPAPPRMDNAGSRIPGFYKLPLRERREVVSERAGVSLEALVRAVDGGGLDALMADKVVENVIGTYGLPFGIALNVRINGR